VTQRRYVIKETKTIVLWNPFDSKESVSDWSSARSKVTFGKPTAGLPAHKSLSLGYNNYHTKSATCSISQ